MTQPRPHAALIRQWADGCEIQYRKDASSQWVDSPDPAWVFDYEYRVKPGREYPKTKMTRQEAENINKECAARAHGTWAEDVIYHINAGLRHAIDAGQVVTREEFDRAIGDRKARDLAVAYAVKRAALGKFGIHSDEWKSVEEIDVRAILAKVKA